MTYFSAKQNAKGCLHSRWGEGVGVFFAVVCMSIVLSVSETVVRLLMNISVLSFSLDSVTSLHEYLRFFPDSLKYLNIPSVLITAAFFVISLLVTVPLAQGAARYFWLASGDKPAGLGVIFDYFSSFTLYFRAVRLRLMIYLRLFLWGVALLIPCVLLLLPGNEYFSELIGYTLSDETDSLLRSLSGTWLMTAVVLLVIISIRYFLAAYFISEDDEMDLTTAIEYSVAWMKGAKWRLIGIAFSFTGWILSCILVLPVIYVYPYVNQSLACFARRIITERGEAQKRFDEYNKAERLKIKKKGKDLRPGPCPFS